MRITLQPAYILHHRLYHETSLLLDVFTQDVGRVSLIARGVRSGRSKLRPILQPFQPLVVSFQGKTELQTLTVAEAVGPPLQFPGKLLLSGFYLNELLIRLLQKHDPHPGLYTIYQNTLLELQLAKMQQKALRLFEVKLLTELGYGLQLRYDCVTGKEISTQAFYAFFPEQGFKQTESAEGFSGRALLALANEQLDELEVLREAKRIMRVAMGSILGWQPLNSRKLFL